MVIIIVGLGPGTYPYLSDPNRNLVGPKCIESSVWKWDPRGFSFNFSFVIICFKRREVNYGSWACPQIQLDLSCACPIKYQGSLSFFLIINFTNKSLNVGFGLQSHLLTMSHTLGQGLAIMTLFDLVF